MGGDANISGISVFNMNTNIDSLSSQSYLDITNIKATSTTIFNNLNSLSSQSYFLTNYTNLNNLNVSWTTKLNGATTCISSLNVNSNLKIYNGRGNITNTTPYAVPNNYMQNGSLTIGDTLLIMVMIQIGVKIQQVYY